MAEPMKRMRPRGIDPKTKKVVRSSGTTLSKTGKKVFSREYKSGVGMAEARLTGAVKGTKAFKQLTKMAYRLRGIDAGRITPKLGERSFLRGVIDTAGAGGGG